jgi:hypothetical protein
MRINHEKKFIFIHVPHTGGTSLRNFLNQSVGTEKYKHKHAPVKEVEQKYRDYTKFSIARNHVDWLHSGYKYCQKRNGRKWFPKCYNFAKDHSFKEYVDWYLSYNTENMSGDYSMQFIPRRIGFFYYMGEKCEDVDHVIWHGKNGFENLERVLKEATGISNTDSFPHNNKNVRNRSSVTYSPETEEMIKRHYEEEIQYFNQNVCQ